MNIVFNRNLDTYTYYIFFQKAQTTTEKPAQKSYEENISTNGDELNKLIQQQGDIVRKLKSEKAVKVFHSSLLIIILIIFIIWNMCPLS